MGLIHSEQGTKCLASVPNNEAQCETWGFHGCGYEDYCPMYRRNVSQLLAASIFSVGKGKYILLWRCRQQITTKHWWLPDYTTSHDVTCYSAKARMMDWSHVCDVLQSSPRACPGRLQGAPTLPADVSTCTFLMCFFVVTSDSRVASFTNRL